MSASTHIDITCCFCLIYSSLDEDGMTDFNNNIDCICHEIVEEKCEVSKRISSFA